MKALRTPRHAAPAVPAARVAAAQAAAIALALALATARAAAADPSPPAAPASSAAAASADRVQQLGERLNQLLQMVQQLDGELQSLKAENQALKAQQSQTRAAVDEVRAQPQVAAQAQAQPHPLDKISLWGYGEIYDTNPVHDRSLAQADLARAVFGIGYQFGEHTRFNSEFEVEHGVSSASDVGEFEVEQFYIDQELAPNLGLQAGLFLIPTGFLNESHEPTHFYGVQRNFVETLVIPSTWREGGLKLHGSTDAGLTWALGLSTGPSIAKWNFTPEFVPYQTALELEDNDIAPLQATHQELALTNASNLAQFVSADYLGTPGLRLGGSAFTSKIGSIAPGLPDQRATLWEAHVRYAPGPWQLSALFAQGSISQTAAANSQFPGTANPIPARFDGWFVEAAYNLWQRGELKLSPFVRYERYNLGAAYEGLAPGFGPRPTSPFPSSNVPGSFATYPQANDRVGTLGANLNLTEGVVFKVDYQHFSVNTSFSRLDFGLGLAFE
jgi:hypothetical protein